MRQAWLLLVISLLLAPPAAWSQGMPIGPEFRVNTFTTGSQFLPEVAVDPSGNFVIVWSSADQDGSSSGVYGQRYSSTGTSLGSEFRVNSYTTQSQAGPAVAADGLGNFVVAWTSYQDGSDTGIFGQRYSSIGAPLGPEFQVNTLTALEQIRPAVAVAATGDFVVAWESPLDGSPNGIFAQRYSSSGAPLGPEFRVNTFTLNAQARPSIASDAAGNFVIVWQSYREPLLDYGVYGQRYSSTGTPLGSEFQVNTYTTNDQYYPSVASDAAGNFVVVWHSDQDGSGSGVFGQRYASTGVPLGSEFRVNTFTTGFQGVPRVASDAAGDFVVIWQGDDGSGTGVFGQRFASSGAPLGPEFRVNTYTTGTQLSPAVAADPAGDFLIAWSSLQPDDPSEGIFAQRYEPILPVELIDFTVR